MAAVLSREDMERIIREGGSVLYGGRTIVRVEDLPGAVELVGDDTAQREAVAAALDAQIAALTAQRARLGSGQPVARSDEGAAEPPRGDERPLAATDEQPTTKSKGKGA